MHEREVVKNFNSDCRSQDVLVIVPVEGVGQQRQQRSNSLATQAHQIGDRLVELLGMGSEVDLLDMLCKGLLYLLDMGTKRVNHLSTNSRSMVLLLISVLTTFTLTLSPKVIIFLFFVPTRRMFFSSNS